MDLQFSAEDEAYRDRLRSWLREKKAEQLAALKQGGPPGGNPIDAARAWQRDLYEAGYIGLAWPKAYGGQDASFTQQVICNEELALARTPPVINMIGLQILAPTLIQHGNEEQRRHYLPRILRAEDLWCQGFSEPEAGSDLASLRCRADLDGDTFVVNGQKVWTSMAVICDWIFLLARSDPNAPKREGISYLLCDMKTPGITVRPLRNAAGGAHFSEVFFDDVRIPRENLVGALHGGWAIARSTLGHERSGLSSIIGFEGQLQRLQDLATRMGLADDQATRRTLAQYKIEIEGLRHLGYRTLSAQISGRPPGGESSVGKLCASQLRQRMTKTALALEGPLAPIAKKSPHVVDRGRWNAAYFDALAHSIGGGTSEIQRNIIAERVLGLPRSAED